MLRELQIQWQMLCQDYHQFSHFQCSALNRLGKSGTGSVKWSWACWVDAIFSTAFTGVTADSTPILCHLWHSNRDTTPICAHPTEELGFYSLAFIITPGNPGVPTFAGQSFCVARNQQRRKSEMIYYDDLWFIFFKMAADFEFFKRIYLCSLTSYGLIAGLVDFSFTERCYWYLQSALNLCRRVAP